MKLRRVDSINVIPFIDIMLVLLVIVLTTASFIQKDVISVSLPKAESASKSKQTKPTLVAIKKNGDVYLRKKRVSLNTLESELSKLKSTDPVELYSDKKTNFENFVAVMQILTKLKHKELYIVTVKN